jgi:hypothetical protein
MRLVAGPAVLTGGQSSTPGRIKNTLSPTIQNIAASWTKSGQQPDAFCKTQPTTSTTEFARIFLKRERQRGLAAAATAPLFKNPALQESIPA